ncbi:MAG TPA: hypothetical protein VMS64_33020 [Candidatus Methylomirabilis sp.]|nr:hypothetical protein [Candidatus Methylomirabilis sp.]
MDVRPAPPDLARLWTKAAGLARFALRVRGMLRETITIEEASRRIEEGVRRRRERFVAKVETAVYANPRSPYRRLLAAAGCEMGDVKRLVDTEDLEGALEALERAGVYVSYDELKGRTPAVRGSQTFHFHSDDFNNPLLTEHFSTTSGGTRGAPSILPVDVDVIQELAPHWGVFLAEHGGLGAPLILWTPGHAGIASRYLAWALSNQKYAHWYVSESMKSPQGWVQAAAVHWLARQAGGFPRPERAPFSTPEPVLERLLALLAAGKAPCVNTAPSAATKLSLEAQRRGAGLAGVTFLLGAEPLTPARRRTIEASGARAAPLYGSSEAAWIGGQCRRATHPDEVHVLRDGYAIIPSGVAEGGEAGARTLLVTSMHRFATKVLLNADIGDRAVLDTRRCECRYDRLGCHLRLHTIRSSEKITELGVTFAVQDVFRVVEDVLPGRFGGAAGDYQLVEARDEQGLPRYTILVNPSLPGIDEERLAAVFLSELGKLEGHYRFMTAAWARERFIGVRRGPPLAGPLGKVLPFHRINDTAGARR